MIDYKIITDSGCDIDPITLHKWKITCIDLKVCRSDRAKTSSSSGQQLEDFYAEMRTGRFYLTSMIRAAEFKEAFCPILKRGKDILYICISAGLSDTYSAAAAAARELEWKYPNRKICVVDSRSASAGLGLLLYLAKIQRDSGISLTELSAYVASTARKICHLFTVDQLKYLKLGGRIDTRESLSPTDLDLKSVMCLDCNGRLSIYLKAKGKIRLIEALANSFGELADPPQDGIYFISHGDCPEAAAELEQLMIQKYGHKAACIAKIGPVIGAHTGPDTLALFFVGQR